MRYVMKGGVWKNSQDEILKAAMMKYGLNQWSRISSLLQRKSAKQCKQRWYEWLDPSIKKTQWTRAEDERLLQLARVFPSQWRTIAPFVGRTPTQCYERYEKLLDMAQGKTAKEGEDLRKLRPGEIDPNPETKPARLDPIDMDEDEKEMLAEVRVRLANTKGKKAKRKQREKLIQEARKLAQLQKIRELEMAGVENVPTAKEIKRMKQRKDIDYNSEIPFKRDVPEFAYRIEESETIKNHQFASTFTSQTLEGKRRDVEEELQRKLDKRRIKKFQERDLKALLKLRTDFQKPAAAPILLPEPTISEKDLEDMRKLNITTPMYTQILNAANANQTPLGIATDKVLLSAQVNLSLNHSNATPFGGDSIVGLRELQHLKSLQRNPMRPANSVQRAISERLKTPGSNSWQDSPNRLKSLFSGLSKPENLIEFGIPEEEEEEEPEQQIDAEELERQQLEEIKKQQEEAKLQWTRVVLRDLPRPKIIPSQIPFTENERIQKLIAGQMVSLLYSDAIDHPYEGIQLPKKELIYRQNQSLEEIKDAEKLIEQELQGIFKKEDHSGLVGQDPEDFSHYLWKPSSEDLSAVYPVPGETPSSQMNPRSLASQVNSQVKRTRKYLNGFERILKTRMDEINQIQGKLAAANVEKEVLEERRREQQRAIASRMDDLQAYYWMIYQKI